VAVDLDAPSLRDADADSLLDTFALGGRDDAVAEVCVGGAFLRTRYRASDSRPEPSFHGFGCRTVIPGPRFAESGRPMATAGRPDPRMDGRPPRASPDPASGPLTAMDGRFS